MNRILVSLLILSASALFAPQPAMAIVIDTVPVGNVGNTNDPATGSLYGGVDYAYRIGKTEVTVGQYTAFLNAVAKTDTYALYSPSMATNLNIAGILQSGVSPNYSYDVIGSANKPVTYVSWGDAARFSNWLHNNQPTGVQDATTTERGAYTLDGATESENLNAVLRNAGAQWFIPTENEWYKAAYHQPTAQGGDVDNYWAYPTRTNSEPYSDQPLGSDAPTQSNTANFHQNVTANINYDDGYAVTGSTSYSSSQNYLTDAGAYTASTSPYGTFDQGGNVWEWNETLISGANGPFRILRGGSWDFDSDGLASVYLSDGDPSNEGYNFGFRVATVPEPSSILLLVVGAVGIFGLRRRLGA